MKARMSVAAASNSVHALRFRHFLLRIANQASMNESQEPWTGSQWNANRHGRSATYTATSAEQCSLTGSRISMDNLSRGDQPVQQAEKFDELAGAVLAAHDPVD